MCCAIIPTGFNMENFVDSLFDAVLDCLKIMPVLFLAYLLVAWLSHDHHHKLRGFLSKDKKTSVLYSSFLGCVPQCGFSSVMADLYSEKKVSLGALIAVFVATSDEAVPIMLSNVSNKKVLIDMLILIGIKVVLAVLWGYAIQGVLALRKKKPVVEEEVEQHDHTHDHKHQCGHIHTEECVSNCGHEHGGCFENVFLDAFSHTFEILIYIFVANLVLNCVIGHFGTDALKNLFTNNVYVQILIASLIGLIPNCASSVLLVDLYAMYGTIGFPALVAGLTSCAGVGMIILWTRNRRHPLKNFGILALQFAIGVASGMLLTLIFK